MKITRLKSGYSIRLNDGEFEALCTLVAHGKVAYVTAPEALEAGVGMAARAALRRRFSDLVWDRIDDDRRS